MNLQREIYQERVERLPRLQREESASHSFQPRRYKADESQRLAKEPSVTQKGQMALTRRAHICAYPFHSALVLLSTPPSFQLFQRVNFKTPRLTVYNTTRDDFHIKASDTDKDEKDLFLDSGLFFLCHLHHVSQLAV